MSMRPASLANAALALAMLVPFRFCPGQPPDQTPVARLQTRVRLRVATTGELRPFAVGIHTSRPVAEIADVVSDDVIRSELDLTPSATAKIQGILASQRDQFRRLRSKTKPGDVEALMRQISQLQQRTVDQISKVLTERQRKRLAELVFRIECREKGLLNQCETLYSDQWEANPQALFQWREKCHAWGKDLRQRLLAERVQTIDRLLRPLSPRQKMLLKRMLGNSYYGGYPNIELLLRQLETNDSPQKKAKAEDPVDFIAFPSAFKLSVVGRLVSHSKKQPRRLPALLAVLWDEETQAMLRLSDSQFDVLDSVKEEWTAMVNQQTAEITRAFQSRQVLSNRDLTGGLIESIRTETRRKERLFEQRLLDMLSASQRTAFEALAIRVGFERHGHLSMLTSSLLQRRLNLSKEQIHRLREAAKTARQRLEEHCHDFEKAETERIVRALPEKIRTQQVARMGPATANYFGGLTILLADMEEALLLQDAGPR